jgi:mannose-6-phosphate isomerase-like protein (cupin superfamily)
LRRRRIDCFLPDHFQGESTLNISKPALCLSLILAAGAGGLLASPTPMAVMSSALASLLPNARAETAPLQPALIDLLAIGHDDLAKTANPQMNARALVTTENATIALQSGNVARHIHPKTDEIQYIVSGSGAMWLGNERREFKPGSLIVIPKGTPHGGTIVSNGPVKAIAIKIPPQPKDDVVFVE